MRTLTVQAYEDQSRPEGGHAVIVVHGLGVDPSEGAEERLAFRLRPIETSSGAEGGAQWVDSTRADVARRRTDQGIELLIGPDIADNEQLMPGTVVEIEFPGAGARGEFLWPNIAPVLRPKRRNILLNRGRRAKADSETAAEANAAQKSEARASNGSAAAIASAASASAASASAPAPVRAEAQSTVKAAPQAAAPTGPSSSSPQPLIPPAQPSPQPVTRSADRAEPSRSLPDALAALEAVAAAAQSKKDTEPMPSSKPSTLREEDASGQPGPRPSSDTAAITASESWYESARGRHRVASEPAPSRRPQETSSSLAVTGGILLAALGAIYMLSRDSGRRPEPPMAAVPGAAGPVVAAPAAVVAAAPPVTAISSAPAYGGAPAATPPPAAAAAARQQYRGPSLFELLAAGSVSPRGVDASAVDGAKALANASAVLQGAKRDVDEGNFWLRRFLQSNLADERTTRVLTQLGSSYAEPQGRPPDYVKARLLWEIASAAGDPVAMCFVGLTYENGLGTPMDRKAALQWYERSRAAGGCPQVEDMISRVRK